MNTRPARAPWLPRTVCAPRRPELEKRAEDWEANRPEPQPRDDAPAWIRKIQDQGTSEVNDGQNAR
jgi:hypothetical protein